MLGAIRRAAVSLLDTGGAVPAFSTLISTAAGSPWAALGMGPLPANRRFDYVDVGPGTSATASLIGGAANQTINMVYVTGVITCGAGYTAVTSGAVTVGCR